MSKVNWMRHGTVMALVLVLGMGLAPAGASGADAPGGRRDAASQLLEAERRSWECGMEAEAVDIVTGQRMAAGSTEELLRRVQQAEGMTPEAREWYSRYARVVEQHVPLHMPPERARRMWLTACLLRGPTLERSGQQPPGR